MDLFEVQTVLYRLHDSKVLGDVDFNLLYNYIKEQDDLIEALRQENLILRKELDPTAGDRMITLTG